VIGAVISSSNRRISSVITLCGRTDAIAEKFSWSSGVSVTKGELGPSSQSISSSSALLGTWECIVLTGSLEGVPNCMGEGDFVKFRELGFAGDSGVAIVDDVAPVRCESGVCGELNVTQRLFTFSKQKHHTQIGHGPTWSPDLDGPFLKFYASMLSFISNDSGLSNSEDIGWACFANMCYP
jgi:hypothetical protein